MTLHRFQSVFYILWITIGLFVNSSIVYSQSKCEISSLYKLPLVQHPYGGDESIKYKVNKDLFVTNVSWGDTCFKLTRYKLVDTSQIKTFVVNYNFQKRRDPFADFLCLDSLLYLLTYDKLIVYKLTDSDILQINEIRNEYGYHKLGQLSNKVVLYNFYNYHPNQTKYPSAYSFYDVRNFTITPPTLCPTEDLAYTHVVGHLLDCANGCIAVTEVHRDKIYVTRGTTSFDTIGSGVYTDNSQLKCPVTIDFVTNPNGVKDSIILLYNKSKKYSRNEKLFVLDSTHLLKSFRHKNGRRTLEILEFRNGEIVSRQKVSTKHASNLLIGYSTEIVISNNILYFVEPNIPKFYERVNESYFKKYPFFYLYAFRISY